MRVFRFAIALLCLLCLNAPRAAWAFQRVQMPMGYYARQADCIIIADITPPRAPDYSFQLKIQEVLRGAAKVGEVIVLGRGSRGVAHYILPRTAGPAAVLLKKSPAEKWDVLESYSKPEEIAALRVVLSVYALQTERQQLLAMQNAQSAAPDTVKALLQNQLVADLQAMREPDNFDLIPTSFAMLKAPEQAALAQLLGDMSDPRGVPLLVEMLRSPDSKVVWHAAHELIFDFPGAPGVDEAFRAALQNPLLKPHALGYMAKRDPAIAAQIKSTPFKSTPYLQAKSLRESGQKDAAIVAYFDLIEHENAANFSSVNAAQEMLPLLDEMEKSRLRRLIVDYLTRTRANYYEARNGIELLRALRHPDCIPALLFLMHDPKNEPYNSWEPEARLATFALRDLGPAAQAQGAARARAQLVKPVPADGIGLKQPLVYLLQLTWLADDAMWQGLAAQSAANWQSEWRKLAPLRAAATAKDEGPRLAALLENPPPDLPEAAFKWIIFRLGDLREASAVAPLLADIAAAPWRHAYEPKEALVRISGKQVEAGALELWTHSNFDVRREAMEILQGIDVVKARPFLRRALRETNFGDRAHAAFLLGYSGTPDDLPLLLPFTDFWKTERTLQDRAVGAVANIRDRFNYDVNGPIKAG